MAPQEDTPTPLPLWLRAVSRLPWSALYGVALALAFIARVLLRYRLKVVRANIAGSFPELAVRERRALERLYYRGLAELLAEVLKSATLAGVELERRVRLTNLPLLQERLDAGRPVLLVAAHQCNWEWLLLVLSLRLAHPLEAAYKPLHDARAERLMRALRTRFGAALIPAKELLAAVVRGRGPRVFAMVADQEPVSSDHKWWTTFLNRPTAFYMGPEKIAQFAHLPVLFAGMRRVRRGHYEMTFELLSDGVEPLEGGELTERYARAVEAQVRASPADWTWSHRRWKLRRPVYGAAASALDRGRS